MSIRIILAALVAGMIAGVFATAAQSVRVIPLILQAEVYEQAETAAAPADAHAHDHGAEAWSPADGWPRRMYTLLANVVVGAAFALMLTAAILVAGRPISTQAGLLWGAAGFAVFVLAPNFGLPPELPGMPAGDLVARQVWWAFTVAATAGGLAIFAFWRSVPWMLAGVALIVAPHVWGAPQPPTHETSVPAGLAADFVIATIVTSALYWLVLGGLLGRLLAGAVKADQNTHVHA